MKAALLVALAAAVLSLTARPAAAQISVNTPDIRDWGCVVDPGDNSTDAAPCINKAWAARKDIYVPAGYWHLRSEISCPGGGSLKTDGTSTVFTVGSASHDFVGSDGVLKPGSVPAAQGPGTIGAVPNCSVGSFTMKFYQPVYPNMNSIADVIQYPPAIEANNMSAVSFPGDTIIENAWDCWLALGNTNAVGGQHLAMVKCSSYDKGLVIGGTTGPGGATSESDLSWDQEAWGMTPEQATIFGAYGQGVNGTAVFSGQPANLDTLTVNGATITFVTGAPTGPQVQIGANLATTLQELGHADQRFPGDLCNGRREAVLPAGPVPEPEHHPVHQPDADDGGAQSDQKLVGHHGRLGPGPVLRRPVRPLRHLLLHDDFLRAGSPDEREHAQRAGVTFIALDMDDAISSTAASTVCGFQPGMRTPPWCSLRSPTRSRSSARRLNFPTAA